MFSPTINRLSAASRRLALNPKRFQSTQPSIQSKTSSTRITTLPNGFRVATESSNSPMCTVGLWVNAGSRNETPETNGTAYFVEHMAFKGTSNRSQEKLETDAHKMGARLNVRTSREETVFSAKAFPSDVPQAVEILADVVQNTNFDEGQIEKARGDILTEMAEMQKNHREVVLDYVHATGFQQTPLSLSVLGKSDNIKTIGQEDLQTYVKTHFRPTRMVLAAAGGVDHDKLVDLAKQYFGSGTSSDTTSFGVLPPCRFTGSELRHRKDNLPFVHVALAVEGVGWDHPDVIPLMVASQVIGSWDRTSTNGTHYPNPLVRRMANEGLCASFEAFNTIYTDTGLWGVYYVSDNDNVADCTVRVQDEIMRVCLQLSDFEVQRAKNTLVTQMSAAREGSAAMFEDIGKQVLHFGSHVPFEEIAAKIQAVSPNEVQLMTQKYVYDQCPAVAALGPTEALQMYIHIRAKMYKINSGIF